MSTKIAMIGAGSVVFSRNLTGDIMSRPEFRDAHIVYMDIDADRLDVAGRLCRKLAAAAGANPRIETTMDRRAAVKDADFVVNMVQIGGFDSTLVDFEIPRRFGLEFTIADTTGPGGLFRALRTYPMLSGLARDMQELCPRGVLLNYSNPMSMNMQTVFRTSSIRAVGLCHSVQGTMEQLCRYLGEDPKRVTFTCAGINHMAFYLTFEKDGVDLYPRLFAKLDDAKVYGSNKVRFEIMRRLGHFITESSEHNAEYCPWFIPHGRETVRRLDIPIDEYLRRCDGIVDAFDRLRAFARSDEPQKEVCATHEYCSDIMHSMVTGEPSVIYGNLVNGGTISNLPRTAIVEAPTLVDRTGLHHAQVGELPPQLVAYMQPHISQHELFIRAAMEGRRDHLYQACMFDPLTAATLPPDRIVEMCDAMIAAYGDELPPLAKRTLVQGSGKVFPRVDARELRKAWDAKQAEASKHFMRDWHVIGAWDSPTPGAVSLDQRTPIDDELAAARDGAIDLRRAHGACAWKRVQADARSGYVDFQKHVAAREWCVGWAYAEVEEIHGREVAIGIGSDDGIRIWVNGVLVHDHEVARGFGGASESAVIRLKAGVNRILVKLDNYRNGWGFGIQLPPPTH